MAFFRGIARSVWLENELKREQKEINQEVEWGQFMLNLLGYAKFGLYFKWVGQLWRVPAGRG